MKGGKSQFAQKMNDKIEKSIQNHASPLSKKSKKSGRKITDKVIELKKMIDGLLIKGANSDMEE